MVGAHPVRYHHHYSAAERSAEKPPSDFCDATASLAEATHPIPVEWTCAPSTLNGKTVLLISVRDLSHELELEQDRDRLSAIAEESPWPMVELDRQVSLLYANPAMISLLSRFGYSLEGFPNVAPRNLPDIVRRCLATGHAFHDEAVMLPEASFSWTFCPVLTHGIVRGYAPT